MSFLDTPCCCVDNNTGCMVVAASGIIGHIIGIILGALAKEHRLGYGFRHGAWSIPHNEPYFLLLPSIAGLIYALILLFAVIKKHQILGYVSLSGHAFVGYLLVAGTLIGMRQAFGGLDVFLVLFVAFIFLVLYIYICWVIYAFCKNADGSGGLLSAKP